MTVETWLYFCLVEFVLCLSPGPAVMLVSSLGMTHGSAAGRYAALGVLAANAVYFSLSAMGLAVLLLASWKTFFLVKWIGAAYLVWLGIQMIRRTFSAQEEAPREPNQEPGKKSFGKGLVTQGANPKLLGYFTAILPQFIDPAGRIGAQVLILALSSFAIEFCVLSVYAGLGARAGRMAAPFLKQWLHRLGGVLLIGAGAGLAAISR